MRSFLYVFVDTFIGGGLVIDSHLRAGLHGNAGAVGSMSRRLRADDATGRRPQLLGVASLINLEALYRERGLDVGAAADERALQPPWRDATAALAARKPAPAIALAVHNAACLLDLEGVIVDGSFSRELLAELLRAAGRRAAPAQLGGRDAARRCWPAPSAPTHARSAARCCRCTPPMRPTATCS